MSNCLLAIDSLEAIESTTRYEYADDIVPHLPPGLALRYKFTKFTDELATKAVEDIDYAPVATLRFIDWDGNVVGDSPTLPIFRAFHLAELVVKMSFVRPNRSRPYDRLRGRVRKRDLSDGLVSVKFEQAVCVAVRPLANGRVPASCRHYA